MLSFCRFGEWTRNGGRRFCHSSQRPMQSDLVANQFAEKAYAFCAWCENSEELAESSEEASRSIRRLVAALYLAALDLPEVEVDDAPEGHRISMEERKKIWPKLKVLPFSYYQVFFTPSNLTDQPVVGDLTDDLEDIYADLKEGLWLLERGRHQAAIWQWRFSFETHWAHHAADAIHALQAHGTPDA